MDIHFGKLRRACRLCVKIIITKDPKSKKKKSYGCKKPRYQDFGSHGISNDNLDVQPEKICITCLNGLKRIIEKTNSEDFRLNYRTLTLYQWCQLAITSHTSWKSTTSELYPCVMYRNRTLWTESEIHCEYRCGDLEFECSYKCVFIFKLISAEAPRLFATNCVFMEYISAHPVGLFNQPPTSFVWILLTSLHLVSTAIRFCSL